MLKTLSDSPNAETINAAQPKARRQPAVDSAEQEGNSTLIEFPGSSRAVPEWRKKLSQRVREVQEQKAREAAEANEAARVAGTVACALPSGQLELVPEIEEAPLNPIVSKALQRVNRARQEYSTGVRTATAAAPALSPAALEDSDMHAVAKRKLSIVAPAPVVEEAKPKPELPVAEQTIEEQQIEDPNLTASRKSVRIISESVEDAALSYLDTCLSVPALASDSRKDLAGLSRRAIVGILDLLVIATMISPIGFAIQTSRAGWTDSRSVGLLVAVAVIATFAYLTISVALSGRTLSMRLLSVKTIDARTGLIPTGGQSIKRAVAYIFSLALFGLGLASALVDRDHRTLHDRFSKTIVVRA